LYGFTNGDPVNFSDPFGLCPGIPNTNQIDPTDCPPGYFTAIGIVTGTIGGGMGGAMAGAAACIPTGPGALVCAAGGAAAGATAGGLLGAKLGAALDVGVLLARALDGGNGGNGDLPEIPGNPFRGPNAARDSYAHLKKWHGIDPHVASDRLHAIKKAAGLTGADNAIIGRTGDV